MNINLVPFCLNLAPLEIICDCQRMANSSLRGLHVTMWTRFDHNSMHIIKQIKSKNSLSENLKFQNFQGLISAMSTETTSSHLVQADSGPLAEAAHTDTTSVCQLCLRPAQAPEKGMKLGPLYSFDCCQAHLYCLMMISGLEQNWAEEGIKGFLVKDIVKEFRRGARKKCNFCKQNYSTMGCVVKRCK